jgi:hypothetical protein
MATAPNFKSGQETGKFATGPERTLGKTSKRLPLEREPHRTFLTEGVRGSAQPADGMPTFRSLEDALGNLYVNSQVWLVHQLGDGNVPDHADDASFVATARSGSVAMLMK